MKYIVVNGTKYEEDVKEFDDVNMALKEAEYLWNHLSDHDKKHLENFYVLESINPDEDAVNHMDGNYVARWVVNGKTVE